MKVVTYLLTKIFNYLLDRQTLTIEEFHNLTNKQSCDIYNNNELKFIEQSDKTDFLVESENGYIPIKQSLKTVKYQIYEIETHSGKKLKCADEHILIDQNNKEVYVKDLELHDYIKTKDGSEKIVKKVIHKEFDNMYDLELEYNHLYYTNDILSHNTSTVSMMFLWYLLFEDNYNILVLANDHTKSKEIIQEIKTMYENLPFWMKVGAKKYNENEIIFENGSRIIAKATTAKSGRGGTFNIVYADELAFVNDNVIDDFMKSSFSTVTSGKSSKFIVTSTPQGRNYFWKMYMKAKNGDSEFKALFYPWYLHPDRDETFKEKIIKTFNNRYFRREYDCVGENTFINIYDKIEKKYLKIKIGDFYKMCENEKIICQICEREFKCYVGFVSHLRRKHKMKSKEYYDIYMKKYDEGICSECGKETNFIKITKGYRKFCSTKCSNLKTARNNKGKKYSENRIKKQSERRKNEEIKISEKINSIKDFYSKDEIKYFLETEEFNYKKYIGKGKSLKLKNEHTALYASILKICENIESLNFTGMIDFILKKDANIDNIKCECGNILKYDRNKKEFRDYCYDCHPKYPSEKYFKWKYPENWEEKVEEYRKNASGKSYVDLKAFKIKYGEFEGETKYEEYWKKHLENRKKNTFCSKISQKLFWEVYEKLAEEEKKEYIRFNDLNGEQRINLNKEDKKILNNRVTMFVDFVFKYKIIEFDGDYFHKLSEKEDLKRDEILAKKGYSVLRIKECDYKNKKDETIDKCLEYIRNEN